METSGNINAKPNKIKDFLQSRYFWKPFLGILTGGIAGFLYYHFIGCSTGSCFITSHSYSSIILGSLAGYLITTGPCTRC